MENTNKYPERVMRLLRQRLDLEPNDTSRDGMISHYSPREAFDECCLWEGFLGYSDSIMRLIEACFNIDLNSESKLYPFCKQEAEYRLTESGKEYTQDDIDNLASKLYEESERWIDSESIEMITNEYLEEK